MPEPTSRWFDRWIRQQEESGQVVSPEDRWRLAMLRDRVAIASGDHKTPRHEFAQKCIWTNWLLVILLCLHAAAWFDMGTSGGGWIVLTVPVAAILLFGYFIYIPVGLFQERRTLLPRDRAVCWTSFVSIFIFAALFVLVFISPLTTLGLRWRIQHSSAVGCIQIWALAVSHRPELAGSFVHYNGSRLKSPPDGPDLENDSFAAVPPCILQLKPTSIDVFAVPGNEQYVRMTWGGHLWDFGIIAGAPTLQRDTSRQGAGWRYWMPGLYTFGG